MHATDFSIGALASPDAVFSDLGRNPGRWALFLDIDGTLLDLAPTPDTIQVPPSLPTDLNNVSGRLDGALALVTGRALVYADSLFEPFHFPIAGLHGAEMRGSDGAILPALVTPAFAALKRNLSEYASAMKGVIVEDKGAAIAAHYRLAPEFEEPLGDLMRDFVAQAGDGWVLQLGKMVYEIRPAKSSKGEAVARYMQEQAFFGRRAVAIGDDLTDESMFSAVNEMGGYSIRVGSAEVKTAALGRVPSPEVVRQTLAMLAGGKAN